MQATPPGRSTRAIGGDGAHVGHVLVDVVAHDEVDAPVGQREALGAVAVPPGPRRREGDLRYAGGLRQRAVEAAAEHDVVRERLGGALDAEIARELRVADEAARRQLRVDGEDARALGREEPRVRHPLAGADVDHVEPRDSPAEGLARRVPHAHESAGLRARDGLDARELVADERGELGGAGAPSGVAVREGDVGVGGVRCGALGHARAGCKPRARPIERASAAMTPASVQSRYDSVV